MWPLGRKTETRDNSFTVGDSPRLVVKSQNGPIQLRHTPSRTIKRRSNPAEAFPASL